MNKKVVIIGVILLLIILIGIYLLAQLPARRYSDNPRDWIKDRPDGTKEINAEQAMQGQGHFAPSTLQDTKYNVAFTYDGFYKGDYFYGEKHYSEENKLDLMITSELNPTDGIPQGIIIERIENKNNIKAYIFLDEDWKRVIGPSYIIYGNNYQFEKPFIYTQIKNGIYQNTIEDDPNRFSENFETSTGGIIVGNVNKQMIINDQTEHATFIRVY
jgi:hypothetical protein